MFNVQRIAPAPACLSNKIYNDVTVVEELKKMFLGKCYLCEQARLTDPEIEHFVPHEGDEILKYDWNNLYYSCSRCNSIKSSTHINLLDCTDLSINVFLEIEHVAPSISSDNVLLRPHNPNPTPQTLNTIILLDKCFNSKNTGLRGITRENLIEKLMEGLSKMLSLRQKITDFDSTDEDIMHCKASMKVMCSDKYPFSVFWKWYVHLDTFMLQVHPNLKQELGL